MTSTPDPTTGILDHTFPDAFPVTLAVAYGWSDAYARSILREYLRFLTLAAWTPAAPSRDVDLTHALHRSVHPDDWADLERRLPDPRSARWGVNSAELYTATLDAYARTFGERPCRRVWPDRRRRPHRWLLRQLRQFRPAGRSAP